MANYSQPSYYSNFFHRRQWKVPPTTVREANWSSRPSQRWTSDEYLRVPIDQIHSRNQNLMDSNRNAKYTGIWSRSLSSWMRLDQLSILAGSWCCWSFDCLSILGLRIWACERSANEREDEFHHLQVSLIRIQTRTCANYMRQGSCGKRWRFLMAQHFGRKYCHIQYPLYHTCMANNFLRWGSRELKRQIILISNLKFRQLSAALLPNLEIRSRAPLKWQSKRWRQTELHCPTTKRKKKYFKKEVIISYFIFFIQFQQCKNNLHKAG